MPPSTRRLRQDTRHAQSQLDDEIRQERGAAPITSEDEEELTEAVLDDENTAESEVEHDADGEEEVEEEVEEEEMPEHEFEDEIFPPPGLKEISSLASWTVSTAKPGNGIAALRSPDVKQFWQSDGPQPHTLSIHFFKLVSIVKMRIYLDFMSDESYTPTKIQFLAGMGVHDLLEFAEMSFEQPSGWIDVDFSNVGHVAGVDDDDDDDDDDWENGGFPDWSKKPVLRAFLVQVRILENHQNGKDTHLRSVQLFARDDANPDDAQQQKQQIVQPPKRGCKPEMNTIKLADWMLDPDIR